MLYGQSPLFKLRNILIEAMHDDKTYLLGKVLTFIDASIQDKEQRKALKDVIQQSFWNDSGRIWIIRQALFQFVSKYCKDQLPKNKEEECVFLGKEIEGGLRPQDENFFPE